MWAGVFGSGLVCFSPAVGLYGYGNAGRAALQVWRAIGEHRFGVREVPGSKPRGNPYF